MGRNKQRHRSKNVVEMKSRTENSRIIHTHIAPKERTAGHRWGEVWRYRDLVFLLTKKTFTLQYKQTILGPLWSVIYPLCTSAIMTIVFGRIAKIDTAGVPHILFYLLTNALWGFFSACVNTNSRTFVDNAYLFGKVYFPRLTVPISNALYHLIGFCIQLAIVIPLSVFFFVRGRITPHYEWAWLLPLILLQTGFLGIGTGILLSSATTKYRDLMILVTVGIQMWMYLSPVIYPVSQVANPLLKTVLAVNPMTAPLECIRFIMTGKGQILPVSVVSAVLCSVFALFLGAWVFGRVEKTFMDTV